jgi:hypothetical protein
MSPAISRSLAPALLAAVLASGVVPGADVSRIPARLDAQHYLFSDPIGDGYTPHLGTTPLRASGARLRHDFVLLAGVSWRAD